MTFLPLNTNASLVGSPFIAKPPDSLNAPIWAKSAGGSRVSDNDPGNAIAIDSAGNSYITGKLQGSNIAFGSTSVSTQDLSPDAFVTKLDASGNFLWTKTFGGLNPAFAAISGDVGQGITVDAQGNVYVIGSFQGTMQLSSGALTSNGVSDVFVLKLNGTDGSVTWGKNFGSAGIEQGFAIALDSSNNAYITGTFGDTNFATPGQVVSSDIIFGTTTLIRSGPTDAFVAKLDGTNGTVSWAKKYGGSGSDVGYGIAATTTGVYVTGNTERAGDLNIFAVKLDSSNGNTIWDKNFGGSSEDTGKAIRVDSSGNAYLTGYLKSSTATFGTTVLQSTNTDTFAVKLNNTDGAVAWAKSFGGSGEEYGNGIGLDGSGNVYLAGYFTSATWNLGSTTLTRNGSNSADIFALKLSGSTGDITWAKSFGGTNFDSAYGIAVDTTGNSYITGEFYSSSLTLGNQTIGSTGGADFFVTKLDGQDPIVTPSSFLDLVFYDPIRGQVSFAFTTGGFNLITNEGLTGDTPVLTGNVGGPNGPPTPAFGASWRLVSASVDVDGDTLSDIIVTNKADNNVVVFFGAARTLGTRQYAYRSAALLTSNGTAALAPDSNWTLDFASSKIGGQSTPGLFWRNASTGATVIYGLKTTAGANGATTLSVDLANSAAVFSTGANSGWRFLGDGEFNSDAATREVLLVNDASSQLITWSLKADRSISAAKLSAQQISKSVWTFAGIGKINSTSVNDNIVWQGVTPALATTVLIWNMVGGDAGAGSTAVTLTAPDRIKSLADVDGDGVLDLIGQFDGNGTIAAYALTSSLALKNTAAPRTQYFSNNPAGYRPAKGGLNASTLELVNVAQYGA
jgi:hypothetical protein